MKIFEKSIPIDISYSFHNQYDMDEIVFFDIETTGLSADISSVYLIGCAYYNGTGWNLKQWFADDYISEPAMIQDFFYFLKKHRVIIHYNGTGFDLPYLIKKCLQYGLPYDFSTIESLDLYKKLQPLKKYLPLENLKLKTVEKWMNITRKDRYDGGELIQIYGKYMTDKFMRKPDIAKYLELLLLHNEEDITGLLSLIQLLSLHDLFTRKPIISTFTKEENVLHIQLKLSNPSPIPITLEKDDIILNVANQEANILIPYYYGELKFFFDNYKDYFYLMKEDIAVHKSVAQFVEKEFRQKAKASNCYTKKTGLFIPQYQGNLTPNLKKDYKDKNSYVEIDDSFLRNDVMITSYTQNILQCFLK